MRKEPIINSQTMTIEQFIAQSQGAWRSMRSGHSLAFQQFEEVLSEITIEMIDKQDEGVDNLYQNYKQKEDDAYTFIQPFKMNWSAESDWEPDDPSEVSAGTCIIIPLKKDEQSGLLIRSLGYAESQIAESSYQFLNDGTLILITHYEQSIAEERIWFVSENVRCRSSILKTSEGSGILQTSFASEVKRISLKK